MPLEIVRVPVHDSARSLGWLALWWIETFCVHGPGDVEGDVVELDDEFAEILADCYALDENGRRLYDSAFVSRAKGRAKSELAGFIAMFEAFGPARFAGWARGGETYTFRGETYVYEPGEPMGRPVTMPFIRCLATEENQAGNTYDNVYYNLTNGPLSEGLPRDVAGMTRVLLPHGGEIVPSSASSSSKDGGKETFVTFDESHLYNLPELRQMYRTVRRNLAKRKRSEPWSLETSTMYLRGEDSIAEQSHQVAKLIQQGKMKMPRSYFNHRYGHPDTDLGDEDALREALKDVYGPFAAVMDLDRIIAEIYDPRNPPAESRRYFLNVASEAHNSWLSEPEIAGAVDATKVVADREMVTLGFDGSRGRKDGPADSTGIIATRVRDGHQFLVAVWEEPPPPDGDGWEPSELEVNAAVAKAHKDFRVVGFFGDPSGWAEQMAAWSAKYGIHYPVKKTADQPIKWKTNQHALWAETLKAYRAAIVNRQISLCGSLQFIQHLRHARTKMTPSGVTLVKDNERDKIDLAVAGAYSYAAYLQALSKGVLLDSESFVPVRIR